MKKISILGCGWLGLPLGKYLAEKGFKIKGSTTRKEKITDLQNANIQPFVLKIEDELIGENWQEFLNSELLILNIPPGRKQPNIEEKHPQQIQLLLNKLKESPIKKLIFISSTGVYGNQKEIVTEETPLNPMRASGKALVKIEQLLQNQNWLATTIIRMSGLVGGERKAGRFLAGKKNINNGNARINMIHRDDCIQIIYEIIRQEKWGTIYNACADKHPTRKEFYISQALKTDLEPPTFSKKNNGLDKVVANTKLKKELNYSFLKSDPMLF